MTQEEILKFIDQIIASGESESVRLSLTELAKILERNNEPKPLVEQVEDLAKAYVEATELGNQKNGAPVTSEEIGKAIREGRERIKRQEAYRC